MPRYTIKDTQACLVTWTSVVDADGPEHAELKWRNGEYWCDTAPEIGDSLDFAVPGEGHQVIALDANDDAIANEIEALANAHGGHWGEHPDYPVEDWCHEAGNNETRLGYWEWVANKLDQEET